MQALSATIERRRPLDLYHAGLEVRIGDGSFVIEVAPSPDSHGGRRGVVAEGSVGSRSAGAFRLFRYEVRCWSDGIIVDIDEAVASPVRLTAEPRVAHRLVELVPEVPTPVWGRDELDALPPFGRAPGWDAGIVVARRDCSSAM